MVRIPRRSPVEDYILSIATSRQMEQNVPLLLSSPLCRQISSALLASRYDFRKGLVKRAPSSPTGRRKGYVHSC